jgi:hypothetical protein
MAKAEPWVPPPDPDFEALAHAGWAAWVRDQPKVVAFDTETTGVEFVDTAFCATVAWERGDGEIEAHYFELERFDSAEALRRIFRRPVLVGWNTKFDLQKGVLADLLDRDSLTPGRIEDGQLIAHLLDENRVKGLKELAVLLLDYEDETVDVEVMSGKNKGEIRKVSRYKHEVQVARRKLKLKKADGYDKLPRAIVVPYAVEDAVLTLKLWKLLRPLAMKFDDLWAKYGEELELTLVLLATETHGLGLGPNDTYVDGKVREYTKEILRREAEIGGIVGKPIGEDKDAGEFNPNSNPQIKAFFEEVGHPRDSYDASELKTIKHPFAPALIGLRKTKKILDYFLAIQRERRDGVLHPSFNQNVKTGRMSSGANEG